MQFSTQLLPKSVLSGGIKAFAAVLCSFCNEVQHSFNKTATIVAAAAAAIVALTYWVCHNELPLGADACISWKEKKKTCVWKSGACDSRAAPAFYSVLLCWLFAVLFHSSCEFIALLSLCASFKKMSVEHVCVHSCLLCAHGGAMSRVCMSSNLCIQTGYMCMHK